MPNNSSERNNSKKVIVTFDDSCLSNADGSVTDLDGPLFDAFPPALLVAGGAGAASVVTNAAAQQASGEVNAEVRIIKQINPNLSNLWRSQHSTFSERMQELFSITSQEDALNKLVKAIFPRNGS